MFSKLLRCSAPRQQRVHRVPDVVPYPEMAGALGMMRFPGRFHKPAMFHDMCVAFAKFCCSRGRFERRRVVREAA
eukprot:9751045-Alexandrium_andersonii.AAC.1